MFLILWCCVVLAIDSPALNPANPTARTMAVMNIIISAAFGLEMAVKLVVKGAVAGRGRRGGRARVERRGEVVCTCWCCWKGAAAADLDRRVLVVHR